MEGATALAMIESGFNPEAHSAQEARGIWQLVPDTARRWGLRVDETVDERTDAEKATEAALSYLSFLYNRFGSWYLAAAAYNSGENRVARIMTEGTGNESGTDEDYFRIWDRLPGETRDFVPVMIAAIRIAREPSRYGFGPARPAALVAPPSARPRTDSTVPASGGAARLTDAIDGRGF